MGIPNDIKAEVKGMPSTKPLYYEDQYLSSFESKALRALNLEGKCYIVLAETCFFPEGGGQPSDVGRVISPSGELKVVDTQAIDDVIVHIALPIKGEIVEGELVQGMIDWSMRYERMKQHTGSHVLFSAIKKALGLEELVYMGVDIKEDKSRIDISYGKPISSSQLHEVERLANNVCLENKKVRAWFMDRDEAERIYGKRLGVTDVTPSGIVRVIEVEGWDVALCCGTHVKSTAEVGLIKIIDKFRLKKGVERIEFTVSKRAYEYYDSAILRLGEICRLLESSTSEVVNRLSSLLEERDRLKNELEKAKGQFIEAKADYLLKQAKALEGYELRLLMKELHELGPQELKALASTLVKKDLGLIVILGGIAMGKAFIVGAAGQAAVEKGIDMAYLIKGAADLIKGKGGGVAKIAQAGGTDPSGLSPALRKYADDVLAKLRRKQG